MTNKRIHLGELYTIEYHRLLLPHGDREILWTWRRMHEKTALLWKR